MPPSAEGQWDGWYYDGRTSNRRVVTVRVVGDGLALIPSEGSARHWPYHEIRHIQGGAGEPVRFEHGGDLPEVLVVSDPGILTAIRRVAPAAQQRIKAPQKGGRFVLGTIAVALFLVVLGAVLYLWGIPGLAVAVADRIPVAWEEQLGAAAVAGLASDSQRCKDPAQLAALEQIIAALTTAGPRSPYTYRLTVIEETTPNAFAAPGGYLVVTSELVRLADRAEEVAGVLAHEIQHVEHRHATRLLVRELSMRTIFSLALGDLGGLGSAIETAGRLGALRYQRADEEAADRGAVRMLIAARIDPRGMVTMLRKFQRASGGLAMPRYLSTHPALADRIAALEALTAQSTAAFVPLLPNYPWTDMRLICSTH